MAPEFSEILPSGMEGAPCYTLFVYTVYSIYTVQTASTLACLPVLFVREG